MLIAFNQNGAALKRYLAKILRNISDVEDVAQEAFLRAYVEEQKAEIAQPKSLLFRIAKHIAISHLRLKSQQITDVMADLDVSDVLITDTLEDEAIARQRLGIHCEAVAALPPACRRVYLLRKVYGMSHREIAEHVGISVSTVEKHLIKGVALCDQYIHRREQAQPCEKVNVISARRSVVGDWF